MPTLYWSPWLAKIRRGGPVRTMPSFLSLSFYVFGWLCSRLVRMAVSSSSNFAKFAQCFMVAAAIAIAISHISPAVDPLY